MKFRDLGRTGLNVSEIGFGAWAIGGAYGAMDRHESLRALARAEELGCNFLDTAAVYGNSEAIVGEFMRGRREHWIIASKYSGQKEGVEACLEQQLQRLGTDYLDLYQIHWVPREPKIYEQLRRLKESGKIRCIGVSLYNENDIDFALSNSLIDCIQLEFSLLAPRPYLSRLAEIGNSKVGVIVRSCLRDGFLTGKYSSNSQFADTQDQRHKLSRREIKTLIAQVEKFRFLADNNVTLMQAAARYPLSFSETSTVILGTKTETQANINFGAISGHTLNSEALARISRVQKSLGLDRGPGLFARLQHTIRSMITS